MEAIAEIVIKASSSYATGKFNLLCNLNDDFRKMNITVSAIKAVLLDAEAKATDRQISQSHQISDWLAKLKDVLYDADDLLDEFSFEALRRDVMTRNYACQTESNVGSIPDTRTTGAACFCSIYDLFLLTAKEVQIFFSESNQVFFGLKMGSKMKEIRERLDEISNDKNNFQLLLNHSPKTPFEWRESYSFVRESEVTGRDVEKKDIVSCLLDSNGEDVVSVIPIVGIGGLGKTALAQLVYNDESVAKHFELKIWISVSDDFSVKHIAQKMLGHQTNGGQIEQVQQELRSKIKDKRFLLVLDDVWNEDPRLWRQLKGLLMEGAKGSKIIVTTRSTKVANIMCTVPPLKLSGLDDEKSWKLFCEMAFKNGGEPNNSELIAIGKDIVKKCAGVPLAIRTIGSLLFQNLAKPAWLNFRDVELSKINEGEKQIFSILRLSYDHLPSQLKSCFAYCSLFPKDFILRKQTLIQLWMAQGFIQQSDTGRSQEDVGHDYFMSLLSRSFFQDVVKDLDDEIFGCKMHDLMHDLATSVARDEYNVVSEGSEGNIKDRARHLSFGFHLDDWSKVSTSLLKANKLRTFLLPCQNSIIALDKSFCHSLISNLKCSRVLDFRWFDVKEITENVGKLKHLRYLDLSGLKIKMLPQSITNLLNLQTLKLNWCAKLEVLPRGINKLVSLRRLELLGTKSLSCMPYGLGQLTCLQTLTTFVVSKDDGARISELGLLNNLSGSLTIKGLEHMRGNTREVESTKLLEKQYLESLELYWFGYDEKMRRDELEEIANKDEMVLEALQPHPSIKGLYINGFCGKSLPDGIGNLSSLQRFCIWNCHGLEWLPESISNLFGLQSLDIRECSNLKSLPDGMRNLKNLKELDIFLCPPLAERCKREEGKDWPKIAHIPVVDIE